MKCRHYPTKAGTTRLNESVELCRRVDDSMLRDRKQACENEGIRPRVNDRLSNIRPGRSSVLNGRRPSPRHTGTSSSESISLSRPSSERQRTERSRDTLSDENDVPNPRFFRSGEKALAKAQRRLSRQTKGSKERYKATKVIRRIPERSTGRLRETGLFVSGPLEVRRTSPEAVVRTDETMSALRTRRGPGYERRLQSIDCEIAQPGVESRLEAFGVSCWEQSS